MGLDSCRAFFAIDGWVSMELIVYWSTGDDLGTHVAYEQYFRIMGTTDVGRDQV